MWIVDVNIEGGREPMTFPHKSKREALAFARKAVHGVELVNEGLFILVPGRLIGRVLVRRLDS
jgi:hypothetical protein